MERIPGWRTETVQVVPTNSGTYALVDYRDNLLAPGVEPWPPPELAQKLFKSTKVTFFPPEERAFLEAQLGHYSDLQSINSEDALTWNAFGKITYENREKQWIFASRVLDLLGIKEPVGPAHIWVWRRLPHPESLGSNGPELDFGLSCGSTLVLGENKWMGSVSQNQGLEGDLNQIQMRMAFLRRSGRMLFPGISRFVVLGVSINGDLVEASSEASDGAVIQSANLKWEDLVHRVADLNLHGILDYFKWKQTHGRPHLSDTSLLSKLELRVPSLVTLLNAPEHFPSLLGEMPSGLTLDSLGETVADTVMLFVDSIERLRTQMPLAVKLVRMGGKLWVCWPGRASDQRSDICKAAVQEAGELHALVGVKTARIDRTWTAIKFFRRR